MIIRPRLDHRRHHRLGVGPAAATLSPDEEDPPEADIVVRPSIPMRLGTPPLLLLLLLVLVLFVANYFPDLLPERVRSATHTAAPSNNNNSYYCCCSSTRTYSTSCRIYPTLNPGDLSPKSVPGTEQPDEMT